MWTEYKCANKKSFSFGISNWRSHKQHAHLDDSHGANEKWLRGFGGSGNEMGPSIADASSENKPDNNNNKPKYFSIYDHKK